MSTAETDPFSECACTAKVLGAYAMFEMNYGSEVRSYEVARRATQFDEDQSKLVALEAICWYETCTTQKEENPSQVRRNQHPFFFPLHITTHTSSFLCPQRTFSSFKFQGFETFATISYNLHSSSYLLRTTTTTLLRCCCGLHP